MKEENIIEKLRNIMKKLNYPICLIKGLLMTIAAYFENIANIGIWFSGHEYVEQRDGSLLCSVCGKVSK